MGGHFYLNHHIDKMPNRVLPSLNSTKSRPNKPIPQIFPKSSNQIPNAIVGPPTAFFIRKQSISNSVCAGAAMSNKTGLLHCRFLVGLVKGHWQLPYECLQRNKHGLF